MNEIKVEGMTCGGCVNAISKALKAVDAGVAVEASIPNQVVKVETQAELAAITRAIEGAGFAVFGATLSGASHRDPSAAR